MYGFPWRENIIRWLFSKLQHLWFLAAAQHISWVRNSLVITMFSFPWKKHLCSWGKCVQCAHLWESTQIILNWDRVTARFLHPVAKPPLPPSIWKWKYENLEMRALRKLWGFFALPERLPTSATLLWHIASCALSLISQQLGGLVFQCLVSIFLSKYIQYDGVFAHLVKAPSVLPSSVALG